MIVAGLVVSRFLHLSALLTLLGCSLFPLYADRSANSFLRMRQIALISAIAALVTGVFWFAFTAAGMSGSLAGATNWPTLSLVANSTAFGSIWIARLILLAVLLVMLGKAARSRQLWLLASAISGIAVASIAWAGHGQEGEGFGATLHAISDVVHLFAAAIWIGALTAFLLLLRRGAPQRGMTAALIGFSTIGPLTVALLTISGVINSWFLIGPQHLSALFSTGYGITLSVKIALFAGMVVFATINRVRLTPRLAMAHDATAEQRAVRSLKRSIGAETLLAACVIAVVALLGTLPPPGTD